MQMEIIARLDLQGNNADPQAAVPGASLPFLGAIYDSLVGEDRNMNVVVTRLHNG